MSKGAEDLQLLMVRADERKPLLDEGLDEASTHRPSLDGGDMPSHLRGPRPGDSGSLPVQRWGVILPQGDRGKRLKDLIQPLIAQRTADQEGAEVRYYEVPAAMSSDEAFTWKKTTYDDESGLDADIPRYLVMLGDLHEMPLALQQVMADDAYVGRLAFDNDEDYRAYADKVVRWEKTPSAARLGRAVMHTVHDNTMATGVGYKALMQPALRQLADAVAQGKVPAVGVDESGDPADFQPSREKFIQATRAGEPSVLLSVSHGEGPPAGGWRDEAAMRLGQGAMSFGQDGRLRADDMKDIAMLPGGIWFMLACYGAGTPPASAYAHWLAELKQRGVFPGKVESVLGALPTLNQRPFVAALPKAVLANPNGPLAIMGHLDLAWTYSFQDLDSGRALSRAGRYLRLAAQLLMRKRVGEAFDQVYKTKDAVETELTTLIDEQRSLARTGQSKDFGPRYGHLWMLRNDVGGYVVLGDPAVRLPLARVESQAPSFASLLGMPSSPTTTPAPAATSASPLAIDRLEEAVGYYLTGEKTWKQLADQHGIDGATMRRLLETYTAAGRKAVGG